MNFFEKVLRRRSYYRATFQTDAGRKVLADLRRFSGYGESPLRVSVTRQQADPIATAVQIGRQEMFQRMITHLHIDDAQLLKLKEEAEE